MAYLIGRTAEKLLPPSWAPTLLLVREGMQGGERGFESCIRFRCHQQGQQELDIVEIEERGT